MHPCIRPDKRHAEIIQGMNQLTANVRFLKGDMKQAPFAELVGVDQSSISRLLRGKVSPSLDTVHAIAAYFDLTLDDLVFSDLAHPASREAQSQDSGPDESRLGIALTSVEKAVCNLDLNPEYRWGTLAGIVRYAYQKQAQFSDLETKQGRDNFDEVVQLKMEAEGYGRQRGDGGFAAKGNEGSDGSSAKAQKARSRRKRGYP